MRHSDGKHCVDCGSVDLATLTRCQRCREKANKEAADYRRRKTRPKVNKHTAELLFTLEAALPFVRTAVGTRTCSSSGSPVAIEAVLAKYDWDSERWNWIEGSGLPSQESPPT